MENMLNTQLPSPAELNAHQKAEVEVNEYLHSKRLQITDDPFKYWSGENSIKWPYSLYLSHSSVITRNPHNLHKSSEIILSINFSPVAKMDRGRYIEFRRFRRDVGGLTKITWIWMMMPYIAVWNCQN